jgi:hypothetical protein
VQKGDGLDAMRQTRAIRSRTRTAFRARLSGVMKRFSDRTRDIAAK